MIRALAVVLAAAVIASPIKAGATTTFARQFGLSCEHCHSVIPMLNRFGEGFRSNGYRIAGMRPVGMLPLSQSLLVSLQSAHGIQAAPGIDEWRLQSGGALGPSVSYYLEQYVIDDRSRGALDQAWLQLDSNTAHPTAKIGVRMRAGSLYLPLPVYADTGRPTLTPYMLFEQSVGKNSFTLDGSKNGVDFSAGDAYYGTSVHLVAASGNTGLFATQRIGPLDLSAYRLSGSSAVGSATDRFWRQGVGAVVSSRAVTWRSVVQRGNDLNANGLGLAQSSSGGFSEMQWSASKKTIAVIRFDRTSQPGLVDSSVTAALLFALSQDSRLTVEDSIHDGKHNLREAVLLAF